MIRSALASASIFLLFVGFAGNAAATNIYFQYGTTPTTCQVKVAAGVDIVADTIGGTFVVGSAFLVSPPNGKTEAGDLYIAAATPDAGTCGTTQQVGIPATPTATIHVPVPVLLQGTSTTPISIAIANATQCIASATYNPGTGAVSATVTGWSGTVCSSASACGALTSATASNLSTGTYVFSLACSNTLVTGNLTSTATASALPTSVTANTIIVPTGCTSPPNYTQPFAQQSLVTNDTSQSSGTSFAAIFGTILNNPAQVPWPGIANGVQFTSINSNNYIALPFVPSGSHAGFFKSQPSAGQKNTSISISTCPGDFRTAVVPGNLGAGCFQTSLNMVNTAVVWDTDGTQPGACHLTAGTTYYVNFVHAPLTTPPTTPPTTCLGGGSCGAGLSNNIYH